ncbi:MAG: ACT domain-containing protein [Nocardioidaceae bacterium]
MAKLVLTAIGPDQPGLVSALSEAVIEHGGNWLTSELARLAGSFAGIVLIEVPDHQVDALSAAVRRLGDQGLLDVEISAAAPQQEPQDASEPMRLSLLGQDRPGLCEVTWALATHGVMIVEFSSDIGEAPQSGGRSFKAEASVLVLTGCL